MSDTYTKLFSSITTSTIVSEPVETRWAWVTMLALVRRDGCVYASIPGLARVANLTIEQIETALERFRSPDPYSRTQDHEGRRIENIDGGWRLLNHAHYAAIRNAEERQRYKRDWDREHRPSGYARQKQSVQSADSPTDSDTTDTPSATRKKSQPRPLDIPDWLPSDTWADWQQYRRSRKGWTRKAQELSMRTLEKLHKYGHDPTAVIEQSIERGWTGLFPAKDDREASNATQNKSESAAGRAERRMREGDERDRAALTQPLHHASIVGAHGLDLRPPLVKRLR